MPRRRRNLYEGYNIIENTEIVTDNCPRVFFRVFIFQCTCTDTNYNSWESPLLQAEAGELCENPECQGNPPVMGVQVIGKTPIQERDTKVFGHFKCHSCNRFWCSAHSWAESSQKCQNCNIDIFPFMQQPLGRGGRGGQVVNMKIKHNSSLCQKCQAIHGNCSQLSGNRSRRRFRGGRRRRPQNPLRDANALPAAMNGLRIE